MTKKQSKTQKLVQALQRGQKVTIQTIQSKFGFVSPNSATAAVSHLKRDGIRIRATEGRNGTVYSL